MIIIIKNSVGGSQNPLVSHMNSTSEPECI